MGNVLDYLRKSWKTTALVVGVLLIGGAAGVAGVKDSEDKLEKVSAELSRRQNALIASQDENSSLTSQKANLEADLVDTQDDLDELQDEYDHATRNLRKMEKNLEAKLDRVDVRLSEVDALKKSLRQQESAARELKRKLNKELGVIQNSKFGDGVWKVGTEITPGIYRASAGSSCYWAILNSADTYDISSNGGFSKNQTVTLTAGKWFETSDCGQWTKIG